MTRSSLITLVFAALFAVQIIAAARRRQTNERHMLGWLLICGAIAALAVWRPAIEVIAGALGIFYAPSALFLVCCGALLWIVFRLSLQMADQRRQIRHLAQEIALLSADPPKRGARGDDAAA